MAHFELQAKHTERVLHVLSVGVGLFSGVPQLFEEGVEAEVVFAALGVESLINSIEAMVGMLTFGGEALIGMLPRGGKPLVGMLSRSAKPLVGMLPLGGEPLVNLLLRYFKAEDDLAMKRQQVGFDLAQLGGKDFLNRFAERSDLRVDGHTPSTSR